VLGEKALSVGHVDIFIKEAVPIGESKSIIVEIKAGKASKKDFEQLKDYLKEMGSECLRGVLIARDFSRKALSANANIIPVKYEFACNLSMPRNFEELVQHLQLRKY